MSEQVGMEGLNVSPQQFKHVGDLSAVSLLGKPHPSSWINKTFDTVQIFEAHPDGTDPQIELRFGDARLSGERLLELLRITAPNQERDYLSTSQLTEEILDDWVVYEEETGQMMELAAMHQHLPGWSQLGREYPALRGALLPLNPASCPTRHGLPYARDFIRPAEFIHDWGTAKMLASAPLISGNELTALLADVYGHTEAEQRIATAMRHVRPQEGLSQDWQVISEAALVDIFKNLPMEVRNRVVSIGSIESTYSDGLTSWSPNAQTKKFAELYLKKYCTPFKTEDGQVMYVHGLRSAHKRAAKKAYNERKSVYHDTDRSNRALTYGRDRRAGYEAEVMKLDTVLGEKEVVVPGTIKLDEVELIPTLRWSRSPEGKRSIHEIIHPVAHSFRQEVPSVVAGFMVMSYFLPQQRAKWLKTGHLPGSSREQKMGPAQVPLLALQQSARLLDNGLITRAEQLVL